MSALKHGFFRRGFMLCDRCVLNGRCEFFVPGGDCGLERKSFDWMVSELMRQYGLDGLVDEILVGRVAMYLIRIARAEVYEANVGVSDKSVVWGRYVAGLDNALRALFKDLALTRAERKRAAKDDLFVDVDRLLKSLERSRERKPKAEKGILAKVRFPIGLLLKDWEAEKKKIKSTSQGG